MKTRYHQLSDALRAYLQADVVPTRQEPDWLREDRAASCQHVCLQGLPGQGSEAWRYTDVRPVNQTDWQLPRAKAHGSAPAAYQADGMLHLFCQNGYFGPPPADLPDGIDLHVAGDTPCFELLHPVLRRTNFRMESTFSVMNRALWETAACIAVQPGARVALHLHLLYGDDASALLAAPRMQIQLGQHSEVDLTISHRSRDAAPTLGLANVDIDMEAGAQLTYLHEQVLAENALQFTTTRIQMQEDARLSALDFSMGACLSRHDLTASLRKAGAEATLNGIYLQHGHQTTDFHTNIEHGAAHARSRQIYKGVLDDQAHAVFHGLVAVHPGAAGTDGYQMNRTLLRSKQAVIDTKPELQIHHDDVKCSHGATIGQLDPQELFYLQSRGIPYEEARAILARAFVADLVEQQPSRPQQEQMQSHIHQFFTTA